METKYTDTNITPYVLFDDLPLSLVKLADIGLKEFDPSLVDQIKTKVLSSLLLYFNNVHIVDSTSIFNHLYGFIKESILPVFSMSPLLSGDTIEDLPFSRCCAPPTLNDNSVFRYIGRRPRYEGGSTYEEKHVYLAQRYGGERVNIIDDVIFSGESMMKMIDDLTRNGITINAICCTVILERAYQAILKYNIPILYLQKFDDVVDVVCSRDLIFGIPDGGINYQHHNGTIGFCSYIEPFGDPRAWASIPEEHVADFSLRMLEISRQFWLMMEAYNTRQISVSELPKKPVFWPVATDNIASGLTSIINEIVLAQRTMINVRSNGDRIDTFRSDEADATRREVGVQSY